MTASGHIAGHKAVSLFCRYTAVKLDEIPVNGMKGGTA